MKNIWIMVCLLSMLSPVMADERVLGVEVIIFEHLNGNSNETFEQVENLNAVKKYAKVKATKKSLYYQYNRLKKSRLFKPVYYQAWQLSVKSGHISLPIKIEAANLSGWLKLQRGYLLNVIADLAFQGVDGAKYHLAEKRRVLFDEVHYLDHPKFGVIVKVSGL